MNTGIIPMRYAKALYAFAKDVKAEEVLYSEMQNLANCYTALPRFRTTLDNPVMSSADKLNLLQHAAGATPSDAYTRFIQLVLKHKRETLLQNMALMYIDLYRKAHHIVVGSLTTATAIDAKTEEAMRKRLIPGNEGTLEFSTHIDPDLIGGFILGYDTYRLDASIATQLRRMKAEFMDQNKKTV